jgi:hypothetical protein
MKATIELTPLLDRFVTSMNERDSITFTKCFTPDAIVEDEGRTYRGTAEIRAWIEHAFRKYQPVLEVAAVRHTGGGAVITGSVSGTFDGSPIVLHYHIRCAGGLISGLRCAP